MCEAMGIIEEKKGSGNDACRLICSLGVFDTHISGLKKQIGRNRKQHRIMDQITSVKDGEAFKNLKDLLADGKPFDSAEVCAAMVTLSEAYAVEMKDLVDGDAGLRTVAQAAMTELALLLGPPEQALRTHWDAFAQTLRARFTEEGLSPETMPDVRPAFDCLEASKLRLMRPAFDSCYKAMADIAARTNSEPPQSVLSGIKDLEIIQSTMDLTEDIIALVEFLADGILNPTTDRLPRATALMGSVFQHIKKLEAHKSDTDNGRLADQIVGRLKPCAARLASELVTPVYNVFQQSIFTHKYLQDASTFHIVMCALYLSLSLSLFLNVFCLFSQSVSLRFESLM